MTPSELITFENDIAAKFAAGNICAPIHLSGGNELELIQIFSEIRSFDYVFCGWRSHYHCLLKGVPANVLKQAILDGQSVSLCFPEYKILSSGIVGGIAPIALGLAWSLQQRENEAHNFTSMVYCFIGDMTAESGIVSECAKFAYGHNLPIKWIIEDNGKSVCTDTQKVWGEQKAEQKHFDYYRYQLTRPHAGIDKWVKF